MFWNLIEGLIRNSTASSAHLGRSRVGPPQGKTRAEIGKEVRKNAAAAVEGECRPLFIAHSPLHVIPSLCLLMCHPPSPTLSACWWWRSNSCGRKWRAKCHFIAPICTPTIMPVPRLTPARSPYQSFSHKSRFQIGCMQRLHALSL